MPRRVAASRQCSGQGNPCDEASPTTSGPFASARGSGALFTTGKRVSFVLSPGLALAGAIGSTGRKCAVMERETLFQGASPVLGLVILSLFLTSCGAPPAPTVAAPPADVAQVRAPSTMCRLLAPIPIQAQRINPGARSKGRLALWWLATQSTSSLAPIAKGSYPKTRGTQTGTSPTLPTLATR